VSLDTSFFNNYRPELVSQFDYWYQLAIRFRRKSLDNYVCCNYNEYNGCNRNEYSGGRMKIIKNLELAATSVVTEGD
jgi:hypothetical protein